MKPKPMTEIPKSAKFYTKKPLKVLAVQMQLDFEVETLEGVMKGKCWDYLIQGIKGELYPCKKEIFEETYEVAE